MSEQLLNDLKELIKKYENNQQENQELFYVFIGDRFENVETKDKFILTEFVADKVSLINLTTGEIYNSIRVRDPFGSITKDEFKELTLGILFKKVSE